MRRILSALLIFLLLQSTVSAAFALPTVSGTDAGPSSRRTVIADAGLSALRIAVADATDRSGISSEYSKKVFDSVSELVGEYYSKVKFERKGNKLHFEFKVRPVVSAAQRTEMAPDFGGILGDLELKKGEYTGSQRMPQQYAEHTFHSIVLMAPYSKEYNCHLYTKLSYPSDTTEEFVDRFKDLINNLGKNSAPSGGSAAPPNSVPDASPGSPASASGSASSSSGSSSNSSSSPPGSPGSPAGSSASGQKLASIGPVVSPTDHRGKKAYLWRATKGKDVIYLLGTIHGSIQQFYPLPPIIDKAFEQSKHLVVEVDILHVDDSKIPELMRSLSRYKPPDKLSKHLTPETKKVFEKFLQWSGGTWEMYEEYKPWFASRLATGMIPWNFKDFSSKLGIDLYLLNRAKEYKKAVSDLETPELQIRASSDNSEATQDAMLRSSLIDSKNSEKYIKELLAIWKEGDIDKMNEATRRDTARFPALAEYDKRMLDDRNIGMANKVEQFLKTKPGPHFIAVGAAHMPGNLGLVNIFKERGYNVEQLYSEDDLKPVSSAVATTSPSTNTAPGASTSPNATTPSPAASTLNKQTYVEQFKAWLPGTPKRVIEDGNTTHYEFYEPPFGGFGVFSIALDKPTTTWSDPGPLVLDRILSPFPKSVISQRTITLQGFTGRELICVPRSPAEREKLEDEADEETIRNDSAVPTKGSKKEVNFGPYMAALQRRVKKNWSPPPRNQTKKVLVSWEAGRNGTITKLKIDRSSGDSEADDMALQAVRRSVPFAPLPPGSPPTVSIQYHFDYNVMHQSESIGALVKGAPGLRISPKITTFTDFMTSGKDSRFEKTTDVRARIQAYLVHRKIFIVGACGTKEWLDSDNVKQFFDSFELIAH